MLFSVLLCTFEILYDEEKQQIFQSFLISHLHFSFPSLTMRDQCPRLKLISLCLSCMWVKCSIQCLCESCLSWQPWYLQTMERVDILRLLLLVAGILMLLAILHAVGLFPGSGNRCHLLDKSISTHAHTLIFFPCEIKKIKSAT